MRWSTCDGRCGSARRIQTSSGSTKKNARNASARAGALAECLTWPQVALNRHDDSCPCSLTPREGRWLARFRCTVRGNGVNSRVAGRLHRLWRGPEVRDQRVQVRDVDRLRRDRLPGKPRPLPPVSMKSLITTVYVAASSNGRPSAIVMDVIREPAARAGSYMMCTPAEPRVGLSAAHGALEVTPHVGAFGRELVQRVAERLHLEDVRVGGEPVVQRRADAAVIHHPEIGVPRGAHRVGDQICRAGIRPSKEDPRRSSRRAHRRAMRRR